jgi:hypothetical protein
MAALAEKRTMMNDMAHQDIMQQLLDNAAEVVAVGTDGDPRQLAALAHQQKILAQTLRENNLGLTSGISRESVRELQSLVVKAIDTVRGEITRNRSNMQASGNKRKVLRAYGTVTVSGTPRSSEAGI